MYICLNICLCILIYVSTRHTVPNQRQREREYQIKCQVIKRPTAVHGQLLQDPIVIEMACCGPRSFGDLVSHFVHAWLTRTQVVATCQNMDITCCSFQPSVAKVFIGVVSPIILQRVFDRTGVACNPHYIPIMSPLHFHYIPIEFPQSGGEPHTIPTKNPINFP